MTGPINKSNPQGPWVAEIVAVGTELLLGEVVNSNAAWISKELANMGIHVYHHTTVGDNPDRMKAVFRQALGRANLLILTGGLGPTDDDMTLSVLAETLETPMVHDPLSEAQIRDFFIVRDMPMSDTNLKQALRPETAEPLKNPMGTAPGLFWNVTGHALLPPGPRVIAAFPGVPRELYAMWAQEARPKMEAVLPTSGVLVTRFLKFVGIGESMLAEKLRDLMALASPTVSPYVGQAEVKIRLAAFGTSPKEAEALIAPVEAEILNRVGAYCYGTDDDTLERVVGNHLVAQGLTLSVAESCTGGLLSSRLTDVPGSSRYVGVNVVTYANAAKTQFLDVDESLWVQHGAVSPRVAEAMAQGVCRMTGASVGVSITGIAGPEGGSAEKPIGLAYTAYHRDGEPTIVKRLAVNPKYSREHVKYWFTHLTLNNLRLFLAGRLQPDSPVETVI